MAKKECDCIFCNFKCPLCGAEEIEITYSPVFTCSNVARDIIIISRDTDGLELNCQECDTWLDYENDSEKLEPLRKALNKRLGIPTTTHFKYDEDHGEIKGLQVKRLNKRGD
jgi:hypothetical protein